MELKNGDILVTGNSSSKTGDFIPNQGEEDIAILRLDKNGNKIWTKSLGGSQYEYATDIFEDDKGNLFILGRSGSKNGSFSQHNGGATDICVIKLDKNGSVLWSKISVAIIQMTFHLQS